MKGEIEVFKFTINNSVNHQEYKNVEFSKTTYEDGVEKECINLVYASNGLGKSTTAQIIQAQYDDSYEVINHFNKEEKSSIIIHEDEYNIKRAFKYDRGFAIDSVGLYKGKLIIAPDSAKEFAKIESSFETDYSRLLTAIKKTSLYKGNALVKYKDILKGSALEKFSLKTLSKTHTETIYNELVNVIDSKISCSNWTIEEYIEIGKLIDSIFIEKLNNVKNTIDEGIEVNFPELSSSDLNIYRFILDYLKSGDLDNKKCFMCGKTLLSPELIKERIEAIQELLTKSSSGNNQSFFFESVKEFLGISFTVPELKEAQIILKTMNKNNFLEKTMQILELLEKYNIKEIQKNYQECILIRFLNQEGVRDIVTIIKESKKRFEELVKKNVSTMNEGVKTKFVENLSNLGFKYYSQMKVNIDAKTNGLIMEIQGVDIVDIYNDVLSESEKTILSLSLFLSISIWDSESIIIIDDPVDSHDEKTKWFIINQLFEYYKDSNVLIVIFTHDLSLSKTITNTKVIDVHQNCFVMQKNLIKKIEKPSLYFSNIYDYVFDVQKEVKNDSNNAKYYLPLAFMMRYLSKNQKKLYKEFVHTTPYIGVLRKDVKKIGFNNISNYFVHYDNNVNSLQLLKDVNDFMINDYNDIVLPTYFCSSIPTDDLIREIIFEIGCVKEFQLEISKILYALLIRNTLEKKFLSGAKRGPRSLSGVAEDYQRVHGKDNLYNFYVRNKTLVNDFAHIESGTDVLLTYSYEEVDRKYNELIMI